MRSFSINIDDVVSLLNLERDPKANRNRSSYNVKCPFCDDKKYHMNISTTKNAYRCLLCSPAGEKNLGVLDLYARVRFGERLIPNVNSKKLFHQLMNELESDSPYGNVYKNISPKTEIVEIYPAKDDVLDAAYNALLDLKYLKLSKIHRNDLRERGLGDDAINRNKYRTLRPVRDWVKQHPRYSATKDIYFKKGLAKAKKKFSKLEGQADDLIIAGMIIAEDVIASGASTVGVPGFFTLNNVWCFYCFDEGMLIPTRNHRRKIVGIQTRTNNAKIRYKTLSSKDLDNGVTTRISRTHFPLSNAGINTPNIKVLITEGPLKADVASHLLNEPVFFIALQGVNNTQDIQALGQWLKRHNVNKAYNAFDMDKATNVYVARAGQHIRKLLAAESISFPILVWDENSQFAIEREKLLKNLIHDNRLRWIETGSRAQNIAANTQILHNNRIEINANSGDVNNRNWTSDTKGIDDYLKKVKQQYRQ